MRSPTQAMPGWPVLALAATPFKLQLSVTLQASVTWNTRRCTSGWKTPGWPWLGGAGLKKLFGPADTEFVPLLLLASPKCAVIAPSLRSRPTPSTKGTTGVTAASAALPMVVSRSVAPSRRTACMRSSVALRGDPAQQGRSG